MMFKSLTTYLLKVLSAVPQHCRLARQNHIPSHMVSAGRLNTIIRDWGEAWESMLK